MIKEKYQIKYEELHEEEAYKYIITGSPTHMRWIRIAQGNTLKDLWNELIRQDEIDWDLYRDKSEVYDKDNDEHFIPEPTTEEQYGQLINEYLKTSGNYYYNKSNI